MDGGKAAIGGFLFQTLVVGGLAISRELPEEDDDELNVDGILTLSKHAEIEHEALDQDVAMKPKDSDGCILVQIKYSQTNKELFSKELNTIQSRFEASRERAETQKLRVDGLWLVTNREVADNHTASIKRFLSDVKIDCRDFSDWDYHIRRVTNKYGRLEKDVKTGIEQMVGMLLLSTQDQIVKAIDKDQVLECLVGKPLTREKRITDFEDDVSHFDNEAKAYRMLVERDFVRDAIRESINRALIVFEGRGGTGKTASLVHWHNTVAKDPSSPLPRLQAASDPSTPLIYATVRRWNPCITGSDDIDALNQLRVANSSLKSTLLHLSLDAVDDDLGEKRSAVKTILRDFIDRDAKARSEASPPEVRLVITCRNFEDVFEDLIEINPSGLSCKVNTLAYIVRFKSFSNSELKYLLETLDESLLLKIAPNDDSKFPSDGYFPLSDLLNEDINLNRKNYWDILKTPIIWRAFLELSATDREDWINGNDEIEHKMASICINRFIGKAIKRPRLQKANVTREILKDLLFAIASKCHSERLFAKDDWYTTAKEEGILDAPTHRALYSEACNGGLITADSRGWRWGELIFSNFLARGNFYG